MKWLKIADNLSLPLETVTQTIAILAKRRAGKSYTMRRLVEQLFKAGQQIVLVDPKGDQHGIRSAADGKAPGLPVIILGGERGDVPLEPSGGEVVAKLVVEERVSVLLDLSTFRKSEVATFMTAFLENLYRLKAREIYRTPMMLVIDEADAIAPQKPQHGEERMLGAAEDIVRRGGQRGIGCVLVSQRSAVLNKNVLTQAQMLVALRTIAPQDLAAMKAWIDVHGTPEQCKTLMDSLPSLPIGDAWFWSPGWPTTDGIFKRVHVLTIETFDSGATPKPGVKPVEPKQSADVDLEALTRQMAATIEKAKADDPRALKQEIATLKRSLQQAHSVATPKADVQIKEVPVLKGKQLAQLETFCTKLIREAERHGSAVSIFWSNLNQVAESLLKAIKSTVQERPVVMTRHDVSRPLRLSAQESRPVKTVGDTEGRARQDNEVGNSGLRRMLIALAQRPDGLTKRQLGVRAGLSSQTGTFSTYLSKARSHAWIADRSGTLFISQDGLAALGDYTPLPTGHDLLVYWLSELGESGAGRMLHVLSTVYPGTMSKDRLAAEANLSPTTGTFSTYLSKLRALQLIEGSKEFKASEELFS